MRMNHAERLEAIRQVLSQLAQSNLTQAICVSQLQDLVKTDLDGIPTSTLPRADESRFCVVWGRRTCHLGHTRSFHLFARLLRRANQYVPLDHLLRDVWGGDRRSSDTVRSAVRQLKQKLVRARMPQLAKAIRGQGRHYGLILQTPRR
jgi:DNA-binding response OmpR family regulator